MEEKDDREEILEITFSNNIYRPDKGYGIFTGKSYIDGNEVFTWTYDYCDTTPINEIKNKFIKLVADRIYK